MATKELTGRELDRAVWHAMGKPVDVLFEHETVDDIEELGLYPCYTNPDWIAMRLMVEWLQARVGFINLDWDVEQPKTKWRCIIHQFADPEDYNSAVYPVAQGDAPTAPEAVAMALLEYCE